ncbi:MAG TPA: DNA replication/repair protein RecF [Rhodopila sp.]|uniref:DNA replication/repair protein RecF n=1 Tax=Rhodopila sp. TaxID=2480087 RepID=UPI002B8BA1B7|nr:DNA replication/repair protein RecF [Rhodopila sp.]HVY17254.1 DNA replication/repair protein RecF [Rhodopila sp.]
MLRLLRLKLTDFRNYPALTWHPAPRISVLFGANGSGKTNLLEAVSLLVPGRGLRGARAGDLARHGGDGGWAVAGRFDTPEGETDIGTGALNQGERRAFRVDGAPPRSQAEIGRRIAAVWLTPQMDRLFTESLSGRRRFLDRLVWALEPNHAREIAAHDTAVGSRNRLLAEGRAKGRQDLGRLDPAWLAGIEDAIARHAVAATAARLILVRRLNEHTAASGFPPARMDLACPIAERLASEPALAVEDWLRAELQASRTRDSAAGSTSLGAHRTDMLLTDLATGTPAALASTGQQKALLIGVILAHARLIETVRGFAPLLLLDEPAVHLDADRRSALWTVLMDLPAQTLVTGTDSETFLPLAGCASAWAVGGGQITPDSRFLPEGPVPETR